MSEDDVLVWCHGESAFVLIKIRDVSCDRNERITFHPKIAFEKNELCDVSQFLINFLAKEKSCMMDVSDECVLRKVEVGFKSGDVIRIDRSNLFGC